MTDQIPPGRPVSHRGPGRRALVAAGVAAVLAGGAVLYGMGNLGKKGPAECRATASANMSLAPLVHGEIAALNLTPKAHRVPALSFADADGGPKMLGDFRGRTVLLNLWATWCVPCRKEMPALDRLQSKLGGADFEVVAVNIDTARLERPKAFLQETGVTHLPLYTDATATVFQVLRQDGQALGLPTTLLIDRNGCQIGNLSGPAEWDSPEALKLIEALRATPAS